MPCDALPATNFLELGNQANHGPRAFYILPCTTDAKDSEKSMAIALSIMHMPVARLELRISAKPSEVGKERSI